MKLPVDWIKEYCQENFSLTLKETPEELAEILSRHSFETEVVDKKKGVLDIEVTPERGDCLSVLGICREIKAIKEGSDKGSLPQKDGG